MLVDAEIGKECLWFDVCHGATQCDQLAHSGQISREGLGDAQSLPSGRQLITLSLAQIERIREQFAGDVSVAELRTLVEELQNRINDEAAATLFFRVPQEKARYYEDREPFGEGVSRAFPSAILDIEEAGKCFAVGRNTACVFHLMRVMEAGLCAVATAVGSPPRASANWGGILREIQNAIAQRNSAPPPDWQVVRTFYEGAVAHLDVVRVAWRNPSMHLDQSYDEERALDIFVAVRGFMRHLSTELKE